MAWRVMPIKLNNNLKTMANFCENHVTFKGSNENLNQVKLLFNEMEERCLPIDDIDFPFTMQSEDCDMTDINWEDDKTVYFQTWWRPNTDLIMEIADHFELGFDSYYYEPGCQIYGQANYHNRYLSKIELDQNDFAKFSYDDDYSLYIYRRKIYDCEDEILEILLKNKIKHLSSKRKMAA